ncbi:MAG: potassium transporter [Alphaproteobacteria bacterium CG11_big_fil_rev_8_21_14_0_20_44_7]|nr:MAG: potassium transporter [Alphaproteobacteria bacterium CG11_big_fil_rev_8_21_14_0_20_44_7]
MEHGAYYLKDVLILLAAAIFVVAIFRQLRLSPVIGFLFAGAAIGPFGLEIITDVEQKSYFAEFGIVFLLFLIGLELSFRRLLEMRAYVLGLGGLQLMITGFILSFVVDTFIHNFEVAIVIGFALALSSTAIVLQVLEDRGERLSQVGRVSFSVLLLQDLAVVPLLILVPMLAGNEASLKEEIFIILRNAFIVIAAMIVAGRLLLQPILVLIANTKNSELFVAMTLLLALGASYATQYAGLSLALGAFLAGLLVAETQFRKQIEADILPFKGLLMGLFFMTIGMGFDMGEMFDDVYTIFLYSAGLIAIKAGILIGLCRMFRLGWETTLRSAFLMSQGGEFAFILFDMAARKGLLELQIAKELLLVVTITMAITPLMYAFINRYFKHKYKQKDAEVSIKDTEDLHGHFVICGFGWVGENLAKFLATDDVRFVAVESEASRVRVGRDMGIPVYFGDAARVEILRALKAEKAKAIIITIHDSRAEVRIIQTIKNTFPNVPIIARAKHIDNIEMLKKEGATYVVPEAFESSIQIGKLALRVLGAPESEINQTAKVFREKSISLDEFSRQEED